MDCGHTDSGEESAPWPQSHYGWGRSVAVTLLGLTLEKNNKILICAQAARALGCSSSGNKMSGPHKLVGPKDLNVGRTCLRFF